MLRLLSCLRAFCLALLTLLSGSLQASSEPTTPYPAAHAEKGAAGGADTKESRRYFDSGTYDGLIKVGTGGTYPTLHAAAEDFNAVAGGINANWEIQILHDLAEPNNVWFGNTIAEGKTVTLRPAPGTSATVTFTATTDEAIPGHLVIGARRAVETPFVYVGTNRFVVDGSNTPGGTTRNLTFENTAVPIPNGHIIHVVGACNQVAIRNCNIRNASTTTNRSQYGILWRSVRANDIDQVPNDGRVENCSIEALGSQTGQGIASQGGGITRGVAQRGHVYAGNEITAATRGIILVASAQTTIARNLIRIRQRSNGFYSQGIFHVSSNFAANWQMDIQANEIAELQTANVYAHGGIAGILLSGATEAGTGYRVVNNIVTGFQLTGDGSGDFYCQGIVCTQSNGTLRAEHNSIYLPVSSVPTGTTAGRVTAIGHTTPIASAGALYLRNNIFWFGMASGSAVYKGEGGWLSSDGNVFWCASGAPVATARGTTYATFAAWQDGGFDPAGQEVNPLATSPGRWVDENNLRFAGGKPEGLQAVPRIAEVARDIDGTARPLDYTYPGAHENSDAPLTPTVPQPDIRVEPVAVAFGDVYLGDSSTAVVVVRNAGELPLEITELGGLGSTPFSVENGPNLPFTVESGSTVGVTLQYAPSTTGRAAATLQIGSNDPDDPSLGVPLQGNGVVARILLSTGQLQFGSVPVYGSEVRGLTLSNTGSANLTVSTFLAPLDSYSIVSPAFPTTVAPGASVDVLVGFHPATPGIKAGVLRFDSNDPEQPERLVILAANAYRCYPGSVQTSWTSQLDLGAEVRKEFVRTFPRKGGLTTIRGELRVEQAGVSPIPGVRTQGVPEHVVTCYLLRDPVLPCQLPEVPAGVGYVKAGKRAKPGRAAKPVRVRLEIQTNVRLRDYPYLLLVLDEANTVPEHNEMNNWVLVEVGKR